ncbi:MAG: SDR family NAD(P)-dependent oxidoreductase [Gammaproteobacteria bacterium]
MKKILVTGADGFIGSHLVEHLVKNNNQVKAFCYYNSFNHAGWLSNIDPNIKSQIEFIYGDIRDTEFVMNAVKGCSHVCHLASLIAIPYSYVSPRSYVETNVTGTLNVLIAAQEYGAAVVHTSTSEVYGTAEYVPIDETHPLKAQSPYAATKISADQLALSFYASYNLPVSIVRPFNTFGSRQSARAIIPTIILQLLKKQELSLGILESTRDFTYVEDTVRGIASFLDAPGAYGKVINLGTGYDISIKDLALEIASILGVTIEFKVEVDRIRPSKSEVMRLCSNNQLAKQILNWSPTYANLNGLRKGLEKTIDWFSQHEGLTINYTYQDFVY